MQTEQNTESIPQVIKNQNLVPPPPPPPPILDLKPPVLAESHYEFYKNKKHEMMLKGEVDYQSNLREVQQKCKKQFQASELNSKETESIGQIIKEDRTNSIQCNRCGYWIEKNQFSLHLTFHVAIILERLLLGDKNCSQNRKQLIERNGVTHIVNAAIELQDFNAFKQDGIKYLNLGLYDNLSEDIIEICIKASNFIHEAITNNGKVFVHCALGKSRSVSVILVYLMKFHQMSYNDALDLIKSKRPMAKPNMSYQKQLKDFWQKLSKENN